jgi:hypothetical protein
MVSRSIRRIGSAPSLVSGETVPVLLLLLAVLAFTPATLSADDPSYVARSSIVTALDPGLPIYSAPPGVGYDGVAGLLITRPTGTFLCSGSMVGALRRHVVTAAHCLRDASNVEAVFFPPDGGTIVRATSSFTIREGYTGNVIDENDIAVVDLGKTGGVAGVESYGLFEGSAVGQVYNQVGFGASGDGSTGLTIPGGLRRQGFNRFDFAGDDPIFGGFWEGQNVLFADFDNGLPAQDASCRFTAFFTLDPSPYCDTGLGPFEVLSGPGDSGGPLFIDGRLAAVASFGITFTDGLFGDIDGELNSTFGEFAGFVPVSTHADWIRKQIAAPEPTTFALVLVGLLALGAVAVKRGGVGTTTRASEG